MDNETLRKQVAEEIQEQFESKLREAKRQKTEAEDEFETAAESWRTERRGLKADIDRLESELNDGGRSQNQTPKIQEVPGPKASIEWEAERGRLTSQISRLERAVADAIERSNNPMRWTQPLQEQYEKKLAEEARQRFELERQILQNRAEWDGEKKKLIVESLRLRRLIPFPKDMEANANLDKPKGRAETFEEKRIHELEDQLTIANANLQKYHQASVAAREETRSLVAGSKLWETERQQLKDQVTELKQILGETRSRGEEHSETQENASAAAVGQLRTTGSSLQSERGRFAEEAGKSQTATAVSGNSGASNTRAVDAEVARVEKMIHAIKTLIDDPATDLPTVIRKTSEKAELDAYLKGVLFSAGEGKGTT